MNITCLLVEMRLFYIFVILSILIITEDCIGEVSITSPRQDVISKERFEGHLEYLGSDLFEGRGTGQRGGNLAARYLAYEFDKLNLIPIGNNNTYYQHIPMHESTPLKESRLTVFSKTDTTSLELGEDYILFKSGEQTFLPQPVELVFVGYGIIAPEYDYNDYYDMNVSGKIVVLLDGEPNSKDDRFFEGEKKTIYSHPESKLRDALSRGAVGTIIIPLQDVGLLNNWESIKTSFSFNKISLAYNPASHLSLFINPAIVSKILVGSGKSLNDIITLHNENRLTSFELNVKISFYGRFRERDFIASNIVGMIRGSDSKLRDTYIIISAHYDHFGIGPAVNGDSIYNGVLDNAMGVAGLLEIAAAFKRLQQAPLRSIIFLLTTGEEHGLLGSKYYTDNPIVPLYKTVCNVNIDGVAFIDRFKSVIGVGTELSSLGEVLQKVAEENNLFVGKIPSLFVQSESFEFSDQLSFAVAGVPSTLIIDGTDYENISSEEGIARLIDYSKNKYHTPFDDLSIKIDYSASMQHLNFLFYFCKALAMTDKEILWYDGVQYKNARLRSRAEMR